jgi:cyclic pyranopterin phosphate synthase
MPAEGVPCVAHKDVLTLEEIARVAKVMAGMGLRKIRLTGGEPLVRKNITELLRQLHAIPGIEHLALTTNGVRLAEMLPELKGAGLDHVNISIDALDREVFERVAGRDHLQEVLDGIDAAYKNGLAVKLNCVPAQELNPEEPVKLAGIAKDRKIDVRFIELMPVGQGRLYTGIPTEDLLEQLEDTYGKAESLPYDREGPAQYYAFPGFEGRIGFISPISHKFCAECNRLRLTAEGNLKLCLYYKDGIDLRELLRNNASDEKLKEAIQKGLMQKPKEHNFGKEDIRRTEQKRMNQIGG